MWFWRMPQSLYQKLAFKSSSKNSHRSVAIISFLSLFLSLLHCKTPISIPCHALIPHCLAQILLPTSFKGLSLLASYLVTSPVLVPHKKEPSALCKMDDVSKGTLAKVIMSKQAEGLDTVFWLSTSSQTIPHMPAQKTEIKRWWWQRQWRWSVSCVFPLLYLFYFTSNTCFLFS